jgi:hypothetical protein
MLHIAYHVIFLANDRMDITYQMYSLMVVLMLARETKKESIVPFLSI